jgi:beta-N-acetylhexosaminidase
MATRGGAHRGRRRRPAIPLWVAVAAVLVPVATVAAAAHAVGHSADRGHTAASCTNQERLTGWSTRRLAMQTIAVPVAETSLWRVRPEVAAGAGGVLLFGSSAPANLGAHVAAVSSLAPGHLGLLVMTDEEGGGIQRMANLVGSLPWPAWMGQHWTAARIERPVGEVGSRMAAAHVNTDLAPVVDVDGSDVPPGSTDPDGWRSFSGKTRVVTRDGIAFMAGLRSSHLIPVLKHFPGLGGSTGNSDDGAAHTLPWPTLRRVAIPPFAKAITNGAPAVMVSNDTVPGLTSLPSGLSRVVISRVLRGTLHFHGLVMTDALNAGAISAAGFTVPAAAVRALEAGADMVVFGMVPNIASETTAIASAIVSSVQAGNLARGRLVAAAAAVLAARHVSLCG